MMPSLDEEAMQDHLPLLDFHWEYQEEYWFEAHEIQHQKN